MKRKRTIAYVLLELDISFRSTLRKPPVLEAMHKIVSGLDEARDDYRVLAFTIASDHIYVLVEADDAEALAQGTRALCVRVGKRLQSALRREDKLFRQSHIRRVLDKPRDLREARQYIFNPIRTGEVDPYVWARGWRPPRRKPRLGRPLRFR